eukprot:gene11911-11997_t
MREEMLKFGYKIVFVALLMTLTFVFQQKYLGFLGLNDRVSIFYIPAAVITLSALTLGYVSVPGIFLAGLLINFYLYPDIHFLSNVAVALVPATVSAITLCFMTLTNRNIASLLSPSIAFSKVNVFDVLYFCLVHAILNTSIHQLLYLYNPVFDVKFDKFVVFGMMLGDITGSYLVFIMLNLMFSLVSRLLRLSATAIDR